MVEAKYPNQSYCLHPPPSTLIHVNVKQDEMAIGVVGKILKDITAFKNRIAETDVFWNDSATGGGHTLFWKIIDCNHGPGLLHRLVFQGVVKIRLKHGHYDNQNHQ